MRWLAKVYSLSWSYLEIQQGSVMMAALDRTLWRRYLRILITTVCVEDGWMAGWRIYHNNFVIIILMFET